MEDRAGDRTRDVGHRRGAYARFKAIAADRRVEFTNPSYAQPYCYNISGESIIRQFGYGMRKIRSHFPDVEFVTYSVEEPCFTSCLPQILKLYGFKYASLKCPNTCWGGYTAPRLRRAPEKLGMADHGMGQ